ncbi:MAG: DUF6132 family protein [Bacteroidota bacterium]|nr:DUF6132 family protein [Bacteroidota bacterium]
MLNQILKYKLTILGLCLGSIAGWSYWYFVGCNTGTCAITSSPVNSSIYGMIMGGLVLNIFEPKTIK